jgi:hypothetical protein
LKIEIFLKNDYIFNYDHVLSSEKVMVVETSIKHLVKHLRFPEAAVETVAKFRQVTGQMFGTDVVMDAPDIAFHIGDQGMDPRRDLGSRPGALQKS